MPRGDEYKWHYRCPTCLTTVRAVIDGGRFRIVSHRTEQVCPHWREVNNALGQIASGPRLWLPPEFTGERSFAQALADVRALAAGLRCDGVRGSHTPSGGEPALIRGVLTATDGEPFDANRFAVTLGEHRALEFDLLPESFGAARLATYDDADFYALTLDFADGSNLELTEP